MQLKTNLLPAEARVRARQLRNLLSLLSLLSLLLGTKALVLRRLRRLQLLYLQVVSVLPPLYIRITLSTQLSLRRLNAPTLYVKRRKLKRPIRKRLSSSLLLLRLALVRGVRGLRVKVRLYSLLLLSLVKSIRTTITMLRRVVLVAALLLVLLVRVVVRDVTA